MYEFQLYTDKDRTFATFVAKAKEQLIAHNVYKDSRCPDMTGWPEGDLTSVICAPIISINQQCYGVIEFAKTKDQFQRVTIYNMYLSRCALPTNQMFQTNSERLGHRNGSHRLAEL